MKLYTKFVDEWLKSAFLGDTTSELRDAPTLKIVLVDSLYVFSPAHQYLSDIVAARRIDTPTAIAGVTVSFGVVDCTSPVTFGAVSDTEDEIHGAILYDDTGVEGTSILFGFLGPEEIEGLPLQPNGADVRLNISDGTSKLFQLLYL